MINLCKFFLSVLLLSVLLCSCVGSGDPANTAESETVAGTTTEYNDPAAPADGGIFIDSATAGEILDYFVEVAFGSEFGTPSERLCRWSEKIFYTVTGSPTDSDLALIGELTERLNEIEGFPGIEVADSAAVANFEIMFIPRSEIIEKFDDATEACAGMSEYRWYTDSCEIFGARAAIDSEETEERNSTICEEILQALGLARDSYEHRDSVFYQGKCVYNRPSELDWTLVRILYNPKLNVGMSRYEAIPAAAGILAW